MGLGESMLTERRLAASAHFAARFSCNWVRATR
jgi:hypothetical protein